MVQASSRRQEQELSRAAARFERWRRTRASRRERIPPELWRAALVASAGAGIGRTARVLRLNEQELRRRARGGEVGIEVTSMFQRAAGFVELRPSTVLPSSPSWVVELETVLGARLRIEGHGASEIDVASLAAALLRASS